ANEGWGERHLTEVMPALAELGVELIEQPLPADRDEALARVPHLIPVCADESCHTRADLDRLAGKYDAINIKLDKAGGLTEALELAAMATARWRGGGAGRGAGVRRHPRPRRHAALPPPPQRLREAVAHHPRTAGFDRCRRGDAPPARRAVPAIGPRIVPGARRRDAAALR